MDVSVVIPAYNRLWCLPRAVNSCRDTVCKTEIVVVDDGSTDGTSEWLRDQQDLVVIRQENQGQTYAINKGTSIAKGEFIRFLDSDDFLCDGTIDAQYQKAIHTGSQLVCSRVDLLDESTKKITVQPAIDHWDDFLAIQLGSNYGSHFSGMLFHNTLVKQVPRRPDFALREDRMFLLEVALLNPTMAIESGLAGYWVQHSEQMQGNYSGLRSQVANWQHAQIYRRILGILGKEHRLTERYKKAACTVLWPLAHWIAKDHIPAAQELVNWIYELDPGFTIPQNGYLGILYKNLGFSRTEKILQMRRFVKYGW